MDQGVGREGAAPAWAGRAVQRPSVPPEPESSGDNTVAVIAAGALIALGIGVAGFFIGRGLGSGGDGAVAVASDTAVATTAVTALEPAPATTPTTVAPATTSAPDTTVAPVETTAAPETTIAPAETIEVEPEPVAAVEPVADETTRAAVLSGGVLYLRGVVPSQDIADLIAARAAAVIGEENVVVEYVIDPEAPVPGSAPLYVDDVVLFAYGSDQVNPAFAPLLDLGTLLLTQNPQVTITVVAHTDTDGSAEFNLELSQRRGAAVAQYWIDRGIDPTRIVIDARGESAPRADDSTPEGAQANRRAEFVITGLLD